MAPGSRRSPRRPGVHYEPGTVTNALAVEQPPALQAVSVTWKPPGAM